MKRVVGCLAAACIGFVASAYFVWDPLIIGYENILLKGDTDYNRKLSNKFYDAGTYKAQRNNLAFMPLAAGFGYLPKDKGLFFMWENLVGIGKGKVGIEKIDTYMSQFGRETSGISFAFTSNFIFGYAFSPLTNLYVSFGSGLSLGCAILSSSYDFSTPSGINEGISCYKDCFSIMFGVPLDMTARYYFDKHIGLLLGLQDIIGGTLVSGGAHVSLKNGLGGTRTYSESYFSPSKGFSNTFHIKFGITTRW